LNVKNNFNEKNKISKKSKSQSLNFFQKRKEKINFCLVGEPTNLTRLGQMMKVGRRGSMTGYLTVYGT